MEYFRFWRIYLSGVEVSDLQERERELSTSRLHIAVRRVAFRIRASKNLSLVIWPSRDRT